MLPNHSFRAFWFMAISGWLLTGCGASTPPLTPVTGTVNFQGEPLGLGIVVFTPDRDKGTHGPLAHGEIQPDGRFVLHTADKTGAVAGWHRVTVILVRASSARGVTPNQPQNLLPEDYSCPQRSGLIREVKLGQDNMFRIDLD